MDQPPIFPSLPLEGVREGMVVVDSDGRPLGVVIRVRQGNAQAASVGEEPQLERGPSMIAPALPDSGARGGAGTAPAISGGLGLDEPELPNELRLELLRSGFIKVDGPGLKGAARYVRSDQIIEVAGNTVRLRSRQPHR